MKNGNYLLHRESAWAAEDKVVDFTAWKKEHFPEQAGPETRRTRPRRQTALDRAELAATLAVAVAFLALAARVLLF